MSTICKRKTRCDGSGILDVSGPRFIGVPTVIPFLNIQKWNNGRVWSRLSIHFISRNVRVLHSRRVTGQSKRAIVCSHSRSGVLTTALFDNDDIPFVACTRKEERTP